jgi:hypothetical protein
MRECEDDNNNNTQNIVSQSVRLLVSPSVRQHTHMRCFVSLLLSRSESAISSPIFSAQFPTFPSNVPFPQSLLSLSLSLAYRSFLRAAASHCPDASSAP